MEDFAKILLAWYTREGRDLPWRHTRNPYRIWLSEIILQQTRVAQGTAYYHRFVERFPDVTSLAAATEDEVLKLWQGLGYYSRARHLHKAAQEIVSQFGGEFPTTFAAIRSLSGVGDYTAAAISSAAFGLPHAAVDGNVYRVLARLFDIDTPIDTTSGKRQFSELAQSLLDPANAGSYNQAIMDFGALVCTPLHPHCEECPFSEHCLARSAGVITQRPVKRGKASVRDRWFHYLHILCGEQTVLCRREAGDIWQGLYEFPLLEMSSAGAEIKDLCATAEFQKWIETDWQLRHHISLPRHQLSHQRIHAEVWQIEVPKFSEQATSHTSPIAELEQYAIPRLLERYFEMLSETAEQINVGDRFRR